uniref:Phosphoglycerate mutase n=1 Tax=Emiliania huxleyi TaxID=2903 RepID=A0A6U8M055_EMIHU
MSDSTTIYLLRHGDRFDYSIGKDAWVARCRTSASLAPSDPPLSAGGHAQAREVAAHLASVGRIDMIIVSPYLRTLQTAQPLAHATGLPLCVDFAVAESHQRPAALPPLDTRLPYFPEIDTSYSPLMASVAVDGTGVEPRIEHLRRLLFLSQALQRPPFRGKTVVVVTHAASVALIAALRGSDLLGAGQLAARDARLGRDCAEAEGDAAVIRAGRPRAAGVRGRKAGRWRPREGGRRRERRRRLLLPPRPRGADRRVGVCQLCSAARDLRAAVARGAEARPGGPGSGAAPHAGRRVAKQQWRCRRVRARE